MGINYGRAALGLGLGYVTYRVLRSAFSDANAAVDRLQAARCPGNDPKCVIVPAGDKIEQRLSYIGRMVWESSLDPFTRDLAMATLNKKCSGEWCSPPRDHMAEVKALADSVYGQDREAAEMWKAAEGHFAWATENLAYRKDHPYVDGFVSAKRMAKRRGDDCDGFTVFLDSLNMASGFPVGTRTYQTTNGDDFDHIAALVQIPPHTGKWYVMDASVSRVRDGNKVTKVWPGWGAPPSMIRKFVDHQILPGGRLQKIGSGP